MNQWRAYYADGSSYSSAEIQPRGLPDDELLGIVEYLPFDTPSRYTHTGYDWYFFWEGPEGLVIGGNSDSREDNERRYPGATLIRGKWTTHENMREVRALMQAWHDPPEAD